MQHFPILNPVCTFCDATLAQVPPFMLPAVAVTSWGTTDRFRCFLLRVSLLMSLGVVFKFSLDSMARA